MVGEGGFGPPKSETTDLQSAPFGHSGIPPYSVDSFRNNRIIADAAGIVKMFFKNVLEMLRLSARGAVGFAAINGESLAPTRPVVKIAQGAGKFGYCNMERSVL